VSDQLANPAQPHACSIADDLLDGADAIAAFLGWTRRRVYYEANKSRIQKTGFPIFRIGAQVCARKTTLIGWLEALETEATAEPPSSKRVDGGETTSANGQ